MKILIIGLPCTGKSIIGNRLGMTFGIPYFSTGETSRQEVARRSPVGLRIIGDLLARGAMSDAIGTELALGFVTKHESWIIDGFPRTVEQAEQLGAVDLVIELEIPQDICVRRLHHRRRPGDPREHPEERVARVARRLEVLTAYYRARSTVVVINALPPEETVAGEILACVGAHIQH